MAEKRSLNYRESVYTPFLRRFTDERAHDLAETVALYNRVSASHRATVWSQPDIIERFSNFIVERVTAIIELPDDLPIATTLDVFQRESLALETEIFSFPLVDFSKPLTLRQQVDLNRHLRAMEYFLSHQDAISEQLILAIGNITSGIIQSLPSFAPSAFSVPLITCLSDPNDVVDRLIGTICTSELADVGLFTIVQDQIYENMCRFSNVPLDGSSKRPLITANEADLPPEDLVETYLAGTPFHSLFLASVPFAIPDHTRFSHTHILGSSGQGKTTLLEHQFIQDISRDDPPAIVVIDPKGTMVQRLSKLDVFNPDTGRLRDRLIILDPADSPAMNMFAPYRSQDIQDHAIALFRYIFRSRDTGLSEKQTNAFAFGATLLFTIPGATLNMLLDLMSENVQNLNQSRFKPYIDRLDPEVQRFFREAFYHPTEYGTTKREVANRIYSLLRYRSFAQMFSTPVRAIDMFDCIQKRKIILVSSPIAQLGTDGSQLFSRFMVALTYIGILERYGLDKELWNAAFLSVDEAQTVVDEEKIQEILQQSREYNLGITLAHQEINKPVTESIFATISTNTQTKYAGTRSYRDANAMARDMGQCEASFILQQQPNVARRVTNFACYVAGLTNNGPISVELKLGGIDDHPKMSNDAHQRLLDRNRKLVCPPSSSNPSPTPQAPPETSLPPAPKPTTDVQPPSDAGEPADKWG